MPATARATARTRPGCLRRASRIALPQRGQHGLGIAAVVAARPEHPRSAVEGRHRAPPVFVPQLRRDDERAAGGEPQDGGGGRPRPRTGARVSLTSCRSRRRAVISVADPLLRFSRRASSARADARLAAHRASTSAAPRQRSFRARSAGALATTRPHRLMLVRRG